MKVLQASDTEIKLIILKVNYKLCTAPINSH